MLKLLRVISARMADLMEAGCRSACVFGCVMSWNPASISRHRPRACKHLATVSLVFFSIEVNTSPGSVDDMTRVVLWSQRLTSMS